MAEKKGEIVFTKYGPFTVVDLDVYGKDGLKIEGPRVFSLCRCGESQNKPFCDGAHSKIGFIGERESEDKKGTRNYIGKEITVHDNRHICCHHGTCNLDDVFDSDRMPWINPDGTSDIEKIIQVIKTCPSGALSYTRDGQHITEWFEEQKIIVEENGPLHVQGSIELKDDQDSDKILVSKEHYTLCRCGKSKNKPFCDGEHIESGFQG